MSLFESVLDLVRKWGLVPPNKKQRQPRVQLSALHRIVFVPKEPPFTNQVQLLNLSTTGIGFVRTAHQDWPKVGSKILGDLIIEGESATVAVEIIHASTKTVGARFDGDLRKVEKLILDYFNLEMVALEMVEIPSEVTQVRVYKGGDNCQLSIHERPGAGKNSISFTLLFFGNYIECKPGSAIKIGHVSEQDVEDKLHNRDMQVVRTATDFRKNLIKMAIRFVENIKTLDPDVRSQLLGLLQVQENKI